MLKDHPASPGCTAPFAPVPITEMVRRQHDKQDGPRSRSPRLPPNELSRPGVRRDLSTLGGLNVFASAVASAASRAARVTGDAPRRGYTEPRVTNASAPGRRSCSPALPGSGSGYWLWHCD
ncbi:hypothetical protein GCM10010372_82040 [Streptomyces tauricus]|nr:hypothetical protein GCM10010372_82040 [Streptomyces tauricus]